MPWIWLDKNRYSQFQNNTYTISGTSTVEILEKYNYCVAVFKKTFEFEKEIEKIKLRVSADCFFRLYINGKLEGIGPAASGGDFLCVNAAPKHYANIYELDLCGNEFDVFAEVRLLPEVLTDYSRGHGGFYFKGTVYFKDGTSSDIETDSSWFASVNTAYNNYQSYNAKLIGNFEKPEFCMAEEIKDIWNAEDAYIPMLSLNTVKTEKITIKKDSEVSFRINLDKIYGVYPVLRSNGACNIELRTSELEGQTETAEKISFAEGKNEYMSFRMHSAGTAHVMVENTDSEDVEAEISFIAPWYPITAEGSFVTDNEDWNKIFDVCKHTLKICRQTLHLDSTKHQELLACTGDYYIESLMTMFCFGDMRLAEFDIMRTADWLSANSGRMFHTTYSLIWVQMILDVYMITGSKEMIYYCRDALKQLFDRFETYMGDNGIIENPPDFMFVDWSVIDGFSMHHPPKYLGQTVLNAFYYKALTDAAEIYGIIGDDARKSKFTARAELFKNSFNNVFYDKERRLYFDGLGTPYGGEKHYLPANVNKKHFSKYPNILASLYGLADEELAVDILERIILNEELQDIQPYFTHYLLCAVRKYGLFDKYGVKLISRWADIVNECDKGLKEGWFAPEEGYSFDHSHAWGGTPAYQMPMAITGLEIIEPGMKILKFSPNLYCLNSAKINIPTKMGMIEFYAEKGKSAVINAPKGIKIIRGDISENS